MIPLLTADAERRLIRHVADVLALDWRYSVESKAHLMDGEGTFAMISRMQSGYYVGVRIERFVNYDGSRRCESLDEALGFVLRHLGKQRGKQVAEFETNG